MMDVWNAWEEVLDTAKSLKRNIKRAVLGSEPLVPWDAFDSATVACNRYCTERLFADSFYGSDGSCTCLDERKNGKNELKRAPEYFGIAMERRQQTVVRTFGPSGAEVTVTITTATSTTAASTEASTPTSESVHVESTAASVDGPSQTAAGVTVPSDGGNTSTATPTDSGPSSGLATSAASIAASADPASASQTLTSKAKSSGGLSQGAKVGLGVGLGVGLAVLLAAIVLFLLARRRRRSRGHQNMGSTKYAPQAQSDLSMIEAPHPYPIPPVGAGVTRDLDDGDDREQNRFSSVQKFHEAVEEHPYNHTPHQSTHHINPPQPDPEPPLSPPQNVFQTPVGQSPVTPLDPESRHSRSFPQPPPTLTIPGAGVGAGISRDTSPVRGDVSPVSPVSPVSAVSPAESRTGSIHGKHP